MIRLDPSFPLVLALATVGCGGGGATSPDGGAAAIDTVSAFVCTGASVVPDHGGNLYRVDYDGNGSASLSEHNQGGTSMLAPGLGCTFDRSGPPPAAPAAADLQPITGITCASWSGNTPETGFQVNIQIADVAATTAQGQVRFCVDDNCPVDPLMPDGYMTRLACQGIHIR